MDPETFLEGIKYMRIHDHIQLIAAINIIEDYLKENEKVCVYCTLLPLTLELIILILNKLRWTDQTGGHW